VQGGVMATNTDLTPGLVSDIDYLYSVYTTAGWEEDNWRVYVGTKPKLIKGGIEFTLPSDVDSGGVMHYNKQKTQIKNNTTSFVGGSWEQDIKGYTLNTIGIMNDVNKKHLSINIIKIF
jgi:hypothetical protein